MIINLVRFILVTVSALYIGRAFRWFKLPLISGFLFTGIMAGPFFLGQITYEEVKQLRFIDDIALGFIALSAGAELQLSELKGRFKVIFLIVASLVLFTLTIGTVGVYFLSDHLPFTTGFGSNQIWAISLLTGTILVARSPSAAIAIINELKAKGPFTQTVLGVTVLMDIVVITLFAINISIATTLINSDPINLSFLFTLSLEIISSFFVGALLAIILYMLMKLKVWLQLKALLLLGFGYGVFFFADLFSHIHFEMIHAHFKFEPLLACIIAGILLKNIGTQAEMFVNALQLVALYVYLAFFTFTGASLHVDVLTKLWPIALAIFIIRLVGIFFGSYIGGVLAGEPKKQNYLRWMGFVTQAGVGLGLAKEVAVHFPTWGLEFATLLIAVIVLNEMIGPIFFKWVIHIVDEAHIDKKPLESQHSPKL